MDMTPQEYQEYVKRLAPKSPIFKDTAFAFFIGGAICALGQLIQNGLRFNYGSLRRNRSSLHSNSVCKAT